MENFIKSRQVKNLCKDIATTVRSYEEEPNKIYFDYDVVIMLLEQVQEIIIDSARCPRPHDLPTEIPWSEKMYSCDDDFNPYVYDGTMSVEDYEKELFT